MPRLVKVKIDDMLYLGGQQVPDEPMPGCLQEWFPGTSFVVLCHNPGFRFCEEYVRRMGASMTVICDSGRQVDIETCAKCLRTNR